LRTIISTPLACFAVALAGCGDDGTTPDGGTPDSAASDVGADSAPDGAIPDGALPDGRTDTGTSDGGMPGVFDGTASLTTSGTTRVLGGFFAEGTDIRRGLPGCTFVREVGRCVQSLCAALDPSDNAGTLTAEVDGTVIVSAPPAAFYAATSTGAAIAAGQTVRLAGTGGVVPAFSGDVVFPGATGATIPESAALGDPLTLAWDATLAADEVEVGLTFGTTAVVCWDDASSGTLTVDAAITADLGPSTFATLKSMNITPVTAGSYEIALIAADNISGMIDFE
jgi:hypothetical protein